MPAVGEAALDESVLLNERGFTTGQNARTGGKISINNDPILHFDFFCAYQAGTLHFEKRERLIGTEKVKM